MLNHFDNRSIDYAVFLIANLINILMSGLWYCRIKQFEKIEYFIGIAVIAMAIPIGLAIYFNIMEKREWWTVVLLLPIILFNISILIFDYISPINWRANALLWPMITTYYFGLIGLLGYSFSIGLPYGFISLTTYFVNLFFTWYAHSGGISST